MRIGILAVVLTLSLAGCFGGGALSQEQALRVAEEAVQSFAADVSSENGGELKAIYGHFEAQDFGEGSFTFGDVKIDFSLVFGTANDVRIDMAMQSGGATINVGVYCSPSKTVLLYGELNYEQRGSSETCSDSFGSSDEIFDFTDLEEQGLVVTPNKDGTVTAVLVDDEQNVTVLIDSKGRVASMDIQTDQGVGDVRVEYGARSILEVPTASERLALGISGFGSTTSGIYDWQAYDSEETAPFSEVEIRVSLNDEIVATFPSGADASAGGFQFEYSDDSDGVFSSGDTFRITGLSDQHEVDVWDTWADAEMGAQGIPGFGVIGLLAAVLGMAFIARRR